MMKSKFNNILTVITAVTFVAALTINIQASFNDPFAGMSDEAITMTTTDDDSTLNANIIGNPPWVHHCHPDIEWRCTWRLISTTKLCTENIQCQFTPE